MGGLGWVKKNGPMSICEPNFSFPLKSQLTHNGPPNNETSEYELCTCHFSVDNFP